MIKKTKSKGFTLVELMVVIVLIGIIIAIAIPNFADMQTTARIRAGAQEVAQDFRQLRERALGQGINIIVTFNIVNNREYTVTYTDNAGIPHSNTDKLGGSTGGQLHYGVASDMSTPVLSPPGEGNDGIGDGVDFEAGGNTLILDSRGGATHGIVYITNGKKSTAVGINSLGKVRVYQGKNNIWF